jgi:hypothetical protein
LVDVVDIGRDEVNPRQGLRRRESVHRHDGTAGTYQSIDNSGAQQTVRPSNQYCTHTPYPPFPAGYNPITAFPDSPLRMRLSHSSSLAGWYNAPELATNTGDGAKTIIQCK